MDLEIYRKCGCFREEKSLAYVLFCLFSQVSFSKVNLKETLMINVGTADIPFSSLAESLIVIENDLNLEELDKYVKTKAGDEYKRASDQFFVEGSDIQVYERAVRRIEIATEAERKNIDEFFGEKNNFDIKDENTLEVMKSTIYEKYIMDSSANLFSSAVAPYIIDKLEDRAKKKPIQESEICPFSISKIEDFFEEYKSRLPYHDYQIKTFVLVLGLSLHQINLSQLGDYLNTDVDKSNNN